MRLEITYDKDADAMYLYFERLHDVIAARSISHQRLDVYYDEEGQIFGFKLFSFEQLPLLNQLRYISLFPGVIVDNEEKTVFISLSNAARVGRVIEWDANFDADSENHIWGIELLFSREMMVDCRLKYISPYLVSFEDVYKPR
jgi:uncharacterized protein YuzE